MSDTKGSAVLDPIQDGALDRPIRDMLENARQSPAFLLLHALPYTHEVFAAVAEVAPAEDLQNAVRQWGQWVPAQVVAAAVDVFSEAPWVLADIASIVPATKLAEVVADPAFPASNLHPLGLALPKAAASLGRLLKARGLNVVNQKLDPYINVDPGTMNPYEHGEVFVTDDGGETDLDLGHYACRGGSRYVRLSARSGGVRPRFDPQLVVGECGFVED